MDDNLLWSVFPIILHLLVDLHLPTPLEVQVQHRVVTVHHHPLCDLLAWDRQWTIPWDLLKVWEDLLVETQSTHLTNQSFSTNRTHQPLPSTLVGFVVKRYMRMTRQSCVNPAAISGSTACAQGWQNKLSTF